MKKNVFLICAIIISTYIIVTLVGIIINLINSDFSQINFKTILGLLGFLFIAIICWVYYTKKK